MARGLRRYKHPGKYEGGLFINQFFGEFFDEESGDVNINGFHGLIKGELVSTAWDAAKQEGEELTREEVDFLEKQAGAIYTEDSQGFVSVDYFEDEDNLDEAWDDILEEDSEGEEEEY